MFTHICSSHGNSLAGFSCLLPRVLTQEREDPVSDAFQQLGTVFRDPDIKLHGVELPCRLVCQMHLEGEAGGGKGGRGGWRKGVREEGGEEGREEREGEERAAKEDDDEMSSKDHHIFLNWSAS